jgi:hypothetical protein
VDDLGPPAVKKRKPVAYAVPYMNQDLRNSIYKKRMYHNKFLKHKTDKNWEIYRKQRNLPAVLSKKSGSLRFSQFSGC